MRDLHAWLHASDDEKRKKEIKILLSPEACAALTAGIRALHCFAKAKKKTLFNICVMKD